MFQSGKVKFTHMMLLGLIAVTAGVWFGQWQSARNLPTLDRIQNDLTNALLFPDDYKQIPEFKLQDQNGDTIDESSFSDQWSMLFFGFTQCPDVCPITLAVMRDALRLIDQQSPETTPFEIVFTSVDPNRDPPEVLKPYINGFNTRARAMTGEVTNILDFAKDLNIVVSYDADEDDPSQYTIDHTASALLVDPQKRIRAKFNVPHEPDQMAADYLHIRAHL